MSRRQAELVVNKVSLICFVCKDVSAILLRFSWKLQARRSRRQRCGFLSHLHHYWQQGTFTGITCFACSFCAEYLAVTQRIQWFMLECVIFSCHVILSSNLYMDLTPKTRKSQWLRRSLSSSGEIDFLTTNQMEVQLKRTRTQAHRHTGTHTHSEPHVATHTIKHLDSAEFLNIFHLKWHANSRSCQSLRAGNED